MPVALPGAVLAQVRSSGVLGIDAYPVDVEVDVAMGLPSYQVVGLPAGAVKEGGVRVRAALAHVGLPLPPRRITVNLAPADVRKDGAAFDLPIAIGILAALDLVPRAALAGLMLLGELSLDGAIRRVSGSLPVALCARSLSTRALILPRSCAAEAAVVSELEILGAATLLEVVAFLRGERPLDRAVMQPQPAQPRTVDLDEVRGLETARRALEVAAAGSHNLLLMGPPGAGKSMLARCLPSILPPLSHAEAIETTTIYSAAGKLDGASLLAERPFRAPHHDVSLAGLIGGGGMPRPGEISLAHNGVLFLDELLEFQRPVLEALRQPLEERKVTIVRARAAVSYPAAFALIAAMNPCPCGHRGSERRTCICSGARIKRYLGRLSGPLLDRFDLHLDVPQIDYATLRDDRVGEPSARVRERVMAARQVQSERFASAPGCHSNAQLGGRQLREHCRLDARGELQLERCAKRFGLSGRAVHRILRVARTIADLGQSALVLAEHVAEAVALRALDRELPEPPA
ncbi:MAG TPA: YifB family Mg chelatase-like AAA ATPase [Polyangia bacterium]|nr:YifB family Mg chelatase-like AAA ATPase [Polyangia bacterium]